MKQISISKKKLVHTFLHYFILSVASMIQNMLFSKKNTHSFYFCWNIDLNLLKSLALKNGESYQSGVLKGNDKFWYSFTLKPNENGAVWIFFNCFSGHEEVKADLTFKVGSDELFSTTKKLECGFTNSGSLGIELIDHKKLLSYNSHNSGPIPKKLHITCNAAITFKPYKCENCFLGKKLCNSGEKDLKIICGDKKEIMAHKTILSTFSPIFAKMIEAQKHEDAAVIETPDCDYEVLNHAINSCYGVFDAIPSNMDDLIKVLELSAKYEFKDLLKGIEFKLMPQITSKNICMLSNAAISSNAKALKALCESELTKFIKNNDTTVMKDIDTIDKKFVEAVFQNLCIDPGYLDLTPLQCFLLIVSIISMAIALVLLLFYLIHISVDAKQKELRRR